MLAGINAKPPGDSVLFVPTCFTRRSPIGAHPARAVVDPASPGCALYAHLANQPRRVLLFEPGDHATKVKKRQRNNRCYLSILLTIDGLGIEGLPKLPRISRCSLRVGNIS